MSSQPSQSTTTAPPESRPDTGKPAADQKPKRQPRYNVVLLDDDEHSYQYVIDLLQRVFGYPPEKGFRLAEEVDTQKRVILLTTTLEHAELKQEQIHGFGPDKHIAACKGAMTAVLEPVPSE